MGDSEFMAKTRRIFSDAVKYHEIVELTKEHDKHIESHRDALTAAKAKVKFIMELLIDNNQCESLDLFTKLKMAQEELEVASNKVHQLNQEFQNQIKQIIYN